MELPQLDCYGAPLQGADRSGRGRRRARRPLGAPRARAEGIARPVRRSRTSDEDAVDGRVLTCRPHAALAREAAQKSIVLLEQRPDVLPLAPERAPRGGRTGCRRRAPAAGRLLVSGAHRDAVRDAGDATASSATGGAFAPGPYYPASVTPLAGLRARFANVDVRARAATSRTTAPTARRGRRRSRATRMSSSAASAVAPGLLARLHERRVPRRHEPRPPGRAARARRGGDRDGHARGRRGR